MKEGERFWVWREAIGGIQQVQTDGVRGDGRADPAGSGEMAGPGDAMGHRTDVAGQTESADREADRGGAMSGGNRAGNVGASGAMAPDPELPTRKRKVRSDKGKKRGPRPLTVERSGRMGPVAIMRARGGYGRELPPGHVELLRAGGDLPDWAGPYGSGNSGGGSDGGSATWQERMELLARASERAVKREAEEAARVDTRAVRDDDMDEDEEAVGQLEEVSETDAAAARRLCAAVPTLAVEEDAEDVGDEARAPPWRAPPRWKCANKGKRERRARLGRLTSLHGATSAFDSPGSSLGTGSVEADTPTATASQESVGSAASQGDWEPGSQSSGAGWASSHGSASGQSSGRRGERHRRQRRKRWLAAEFRAAGSDVASSQEARGSDEEAEEEASQEP